MAGRGSRHRMRHGRARRQAAQIERSLLAKPGEPPREKPRPRPRVQTYRRPELEIGRPDLGPTLEGPEEVWRMNLYQYYRGHLRRRPRIPAGITPRRVREILRVVYEAIPQHMVVPALRRGRRTGGGRPSTAASAWRPAPPRGGPQQAQPQS